MAEIKTDKDIQRDKLAFLMHKVNMFASFYRANPHRFAADYLNLKLKVFQQIIIYMMTFSTNFIYLAARGIGKSFIIAVWCCIQCILYPGTVICVASKTRGQAKEIIDKIQTILMPKSANLRAEIADLTNNATASYVIFRNTSQIKIVTAAESARHNRATAIVVDEFVKVDLNIIDTILRKFLTVSRHPGFMDKPEYRDYPQERNKEVYASSCFYEAHWSYEKTRSYAANMVSGRKFFVCSIPYQLAIKEGMLSREQIADEMSESTFSDVSFQMEMQALFFSEADGGLYSFDDISRTRKIKYAYYPKSLTDRLGDKRVHIPPKQHGEIRLLSADIALMSSKKRDNDASSIFISQLNPTAGDKYMKNIIYTENYEGVRTETQALIIRKLFEEYDCDYIIIDAKGVGLGVVDALLGELYDPDTGATYGALSCKNNQEIADRCVVKGAPKVIWAVMGSAAFNSECALGLRDAFKQGGIRLLINEYDCEDELMSIPGFSKLTPAEQLKFKLPYIHTSLLVNELINLEYDATPNGVRVREKTGMRKDRYSSLSYNIYVAKELERDLAGRNTRRLGENLAIQFKVPILRKW